MEQKKRYQVFISSTLSDLKAERLAVLNQLLSINCIPVGMELFQAADEEQFEYIKRLIDESDYYVVIIAGRYGSLADGGFSYTEKEYDYAVMKKIPVLTFLHEHPGRIPTEFTDPENALKLADFRKKVSTKKSVKYWTNADNLSSTVRSALLNAFETRARIGWVRADSVVMSSQIEEKLTQEIKTNYEHKKTIDMLKRDCDELNKKLKESRKHESAINSQLNESFEQLDSLTQHQTITLMSHHQSQLQHRELLNKNEPYFIGCWNGKPLEWLVLDVQLDRALLVTNNCILRAPFNEKQQKVTWAECSLRNEVLPKLMEQIFDANDYKRVLLKHNENRNNELCRTIGGADTDDRLFLLSITEVLYYFPYDESLIAYLEGEPVWWWLRASTGRSAVLVDSNGFVDRSYVSWSRGAVRPAFWLSLES